MLKPITLLLLAAAFLAASPAANAQARRKTSPAAKARGAKAQAAKPATRTGAEIFACPMHPEVTAKAAGRRCPKCGMNLVKADPAAAATAGPAEPAAAKTTTPEAVEPVRIPETPVLDQDGRRLDFYKDLVKGRTVAINFVFTTCAGVCPPLTATFRRVQQMLGERAGREVSLISVSVDPTTDTPERLKAFAEKFKAGPGWTFVTGGKPEIGALLKSLGVGTADKADHTAMILVGNDAAGHWTRAYGLSPASTLVKVIDEAAARKPAATTEASAAAAPDGKSVSAKSAAYFPNHTLVTQDDKTVRFYDDMLKGKVVLINFMFTQCAGVCSPMTANMAKVQSYLGERVGREVSMLSISVDPANDTPAVLKAYAAKHKAGPGWYFLTGKKENVDWVLHKLGGYVAEPGQHSSVLIIGNEATGEWIKVHAMSSPADIAAAVVKLAGDKAASHTR
ncbi:MAG TPA: SCO family protein [Pyrinomonadaceae bacterium]|jgi:cytochrome oxidase Cu insertion factor (SCO1/SenC/PrrC family)